MPYNASYIPNMVELERSMPKVPAILPAQPLPGSVELIEQLAAVSAVRHVSFVYVVMPMLEDMGHALDYPDHLTVTGKDGPMDVPIINLGRSDRFPQMFDPQLWHDYAHFTGAGARLATQILAEQLKQWYALHGGAPACG